MSYIDTTKNEQTASIKHHSLFEKRIIKNALLDAFKKLHPKVMIKNPVMFCVEVTALLVTLIFISQLLSNHSAPLFLTAQIALWLWFTVLFGNFAEAIAEGKGKAQAQSLKQTKSNLKAKRLLQENSHQFDIIDAPELQYGDIILVETGDFIPGDGDVIEGIAAVDESAITGESAPVIRESGGDRCAVTAGTRVISDWIKVKITSKPGDSFIDRMIALVEGAERKKTPNELALNILLAGFTLIFIVVVCTTLCFSLYTKHAVPISLLIALFVTLIPTTISGLLSAIGISGMDRLLHANVLAKSGRAVEAAGDIDTLLLDKTGTITIGNRFASEFIPLPGISKSDLAKAALLCSLDDTTPEGRSIITLAEENYHLDSEHFDKKVMEFIPFSAYTRMSGVKLANHEIRKGAADAIFCWAQKNAIKVPEQAQHIISQVSEQGGTPLAVCNNQQLLGVIHLKDVIKRGIAERFAELRRMGVKTVMVTGDNPLTAAAIASEAGVDEFLAEATPEKKLELIQKEQALGKMVAMCGDGTNDAPALAQADVGVAMATGTSAAREAGNMVDLDSDPTKLIDIIKTGKQLLMTRGALTTFSITNDVAKYFAIIPAIFASSYPILQKMNIMHLATPESAVLSAIIFNALIIICLIPMALKGVTYRAVSAASALKRNLIIYGLGGILVPFIGIKIIDIVVHALGLA